MTCTHSSIVYGPVVSRRLGRSLGVNILPLDGKVCSFDCLYCECGLNPKGGRRLFLPSRQEIREALREALLHLTAPVEVITFAGNGEPTLHPHFADIIADTLSLRETLAPGVRIAVLSNATMIHLPQIAGALSRVDDCILKLDSALAERVRQINNPRSGYITPSRLLPYFRKLSGKAVIQTLFLKGSYKGVRVDNTAAEEIEAWIEFLLKIEPMGVMVYTLDRQTPVEGLEAVSEEELEGIGRRVTEAGLRLWENRKAEP